MLPNFSYVRPQSLAEAIRRHAGDDSRIHAGGTDLLGCLRDGVLQAETVVSLSGLFELRGIEGTSDGGLRIGAMTTIAEVAGSLPIRQRYGALASAAAAVASPQLRNQGTIGGNLCQKPRCMYYRGEFHCIRKGGDTCYAYEGENQNHCIFGGESCYIVHPSDTAPALVALGAEARIVGPHGTRKVPIEEFHVLPAVDPRRETVLEGGEILAEVLLPPPPSPELRSSYRKVRSRRAWDFALAGVALAVVFEEEIVTAARVVLSGAAPVPWRARAAEEAIIGERLGATSASRAARTALARAEPLAQNRYKVALFRGLIEEELLAIGTG